MDTGRTHIRCHRYDLIGRNVFAAGRQEVIQMPEEGTTRQEGDGSKQRKDAVQIDVEMF